MMNLVIFQEGYNAANSYLGYDPETKQAFIVDPGREDSSYLNFLKEHDLKLDKILLTHGHFDHMNGAKKLSEETGARIYAADAEADLLRDASLNMTRMIGEPKELEAQVYLKPGEVFEVVPGTAFEVLATPGHTKGSVCFYDPEDSLLISGDTVFQGSIGRTDFPGGSYDEIMDSLNRIMQLPEDTQILPGHGNPTSVEVEKRTNPFYVR